MQSSLPDYTEETELILLSYHIYQLDRVTKAFLIGVIRAINTTGISTITPPIQANDILLILKGLLSLYVNDQLFSSWLTEQASQKVSAYFLSCKQKTKMVIKSHRNHTGSQTTCRWAIRLPFRNYVEGQTYGLLHRLPNHLLECKHSLQPDSKLALSSITVCLNKVYCFSMSFF